MEIKNLDNVLESMLFVAGNGLGCEDIISLLELDKKTLNAAIERLKAKYSGECGIHLLVYNGKLQFGSNPVYADTIGLVLNPVREKELTNATLETVAIIAYKQPVTKLEIEQVRGLSSDYAVQVLQKHNLIEVVGRKDTIGKPLLYGTTDEFLKRFQIESLDQLPDYEELLETIKVVNEAAASQSLYNEFEIPEEETGDAAEAADSGDFELPEEEVPSFLKDEEQVIKID